MRLITADEIKRIGLSPSCCVDWVRESFLMKDRAQLPAKISLHPQGGDFFNTMPCVLPEEYNIFGVKVVHRIKDAVPTLGSEILLYNSKTGELLAMLDGDWITTMRTGAVATLAIQTFRRSGKLVYSFIGLGNTARATLLCLLDSEPMAEHEVLLLKYKDQEIDFMSRFSSYKNVTFTPCSTIEEIIERSDVVVSCITEADGLLCEDSTKFKKGCLVVPVHTKGFQNCDLFFDKVYADDTAHVSGFKYFNSFRQYAEIRDVLVGNCAGRHSDEERILSYNIGLALHDVLFAYRVIEKLKGSSCEVTWEKESNKFWI